MWTAACALAYELPIATNDLADLTALSNFAGSLVIVHRTCDGRLSRGARVVPEAVGRRYRAGAILSRRLICDLT